MYTHPNQLLNIAAIAVYVTCTHSPFHPLFPELDIVPIKWNNATSWEMPVHTYIILYSQI